MLGDLYSDEGLAKIEQQRSDTETLGSGASYIGGADVAAAGGTNVLLAKDSDKQIAKWDRAQKVCQRDGDEPGIHGVIWMSLPSVDVDDAGLTAL